MNLLETTGLIHEVSGARVFKSRFIDQGYYMVVPNGTALGDIYINHRDAEKAAQMTNEKAAEFLGKLKSVKKKREQ